MYDFVVLCGSQANAEKSLEEIKQLMGRMGLEPHPEDRHGWWKRGLQRKVLTSWGFIFK